MEYELDRIGTAAFQLLCIHLAEDLTGCSLPTTDATSASNLLIRTTNSSLAGFPGR